MNGSASAAAQMPALPGASFTAWVAASSTCSRDGSVATIRAVGRSSLAILIAGVAPAA